MVKPGTIQGKLFFAYSSFILCIIIVFITSFYIYTAGTLVKKASESLNQTAAYISAQFEAEYNEMDALSQKILFSEPIREIFYSDIYSQINGSKINSQRTFIQLIYSITGTTFPVSQINMFQLNGNCTRIGDFNGFFKLDDTMAGNIPWVQEAVLNDGKALITAPHKDNWGTSANTVISLLRSFSRSFGQSSDSVLELQQDYSVFQKIVQKSLAASESKKAAQSKVYIFNKRGELIYPCELSENPQKFGFYWNIAKNAVSSSQTVSLKNPETNTDEIIASVKSDISGWTVTVSESEAFMLSPVVKFRNNLLVGGMVIILLSLLLSYTVSRNLTIPIKKIHKSIQNLSLGTLKTDMPRQMNSGVNELEELNLSFADMCKKLQQSLDELVSSRSHEIQARLLALQAQMNPHFLYNTLATIHILAEKSGQQDIVKICRDLSSMLRYISSDAPSLVSIHTELLHIISYINLMKTKYGQSLVFNLQVPEEMYCVQIPKLVIQPLVENCMKYGINIEPPWIIQIDGKITGNSWEVTIQDNGPGFDDKFIYPLMEKLNALDLLNTVPNLKLDGMGLQNIYIRLKLLYGENSVFQLKNLPDGGAMVIIGGLVNLKGEE
jgi:two-component system, sensor histidine kinase YesM